MAIYEATIESGWPADDTFGYLATFSNAAAWDPGVRSGERLDGGAVRTGSRFRLVVPFLGRTVALVYQVIFYSADDRRVTLEARNALLRARDEISVRPRGRERGAQVSYRAEVTLRGPLRLLDPVLGRAFRTVGERAAAGLTAALAAEHARPRAGARTRGRDRAADTP